MERFRNRAEAGRLLAERLEAYRDRGDVVVLALPRGGVPVAFELARVLGAPLDVFVVRKLGVPGHEELAFGAVASGGARVLNDEVVASAGLDDETIEAVTGRRREELDRREHDYRGDGEAADVRERTVVLVDDGLATGATMRAAVAALRERGPRRIVVAVPAAPPAAVARLRGEVDEVVYLIAPEPFLAVGAWYDDFSETTDDEVRALLARAGGG